MKISLHFIETALKTNFGKCCDLYAADKSCPLNPDAITLFCESPTTPKQKNFDWIQFYSEQVNRQESVLYIFNQTIPAEEDFPQGIIVIRKPEPAENAAEHARLTEELSSRKAPVLLIESILSQEILTSILHSIVKISSDWEKRLLEMVLRNEPIQRIMASAQLLLENPFYVLRDDLTLVAISDSPELDHEETIIYMKETGNLPPDRLGNEIKINKTFKTFENGQDTEVIKPDYFDDRYCRTRICFSNNFYGYIIAIEYNRRINRIDIELQERLSEIFAYWFRTNSSADQSDRHSYQEKLLLDILEKRKSLSGEKAEDYLKFLGFEKESSYYVVCLDSQSTGKIKNSQTIMKILTGFTNTRYVMYKDFFYMVLQDTNERIDASDFAAHLNSFGLKCGVSEKFSTMENLIKYFEEARFTVFMIELYGENQCVTQLSKYYTEYVSWVFQKYTKTNPHSRALEKLKVFDFEHDTDYVETLRVYLTNERNIAKTAEVLNFHRNSVLYRIKKIQDIMEIDFDDSQNRILVTLAIYASVSNLLSKEFEE